MLAPGSQQHDQDIRPHAEDHAAQCAAALQRSFQTVVDTCRKPLFARFTGTALVAAIDLVTACDMRYSTADAQFFPIKESHGHWRRCRHPNKDCPTLWYGMMRNWPIPRRAFDAALEAARMGLVNRTLRQP